MKDTKERKEAQPVPGAPPPRAAARRCSDSVAVSARGVDRADESGGRRAGGRAGRPWAVGERGQSAQVHDVGLVDAPAPRLRPAPLPAQTFLHLLCKTLYPAIDRGVVHPDASLGHHRFEVVIADRVPAVPAHRPEHDLTPKVASLEITNALPPSTLQAAQTVHRLAKLCNRACGGLSLPATRPVASPHCVTNRLARYPKPSQPLSGIGSLNW